MQKIIHMMQSNSQAIVSALGTHIWISFISVVIAACIAIPVAILLMNHRKLGEGMLQVTGVIQTIPSLAILGLLIPIVGIGTVPAVIALVLYALMPIFQNTYAGLTQIDSELLEAAEAFGLTSWYKLWKIRLPLALPLIFTGLRIATVMVIGTATLAALIGGGGLGTFIMQGIQNNDNPELLIGAGLSALLAVVFSIGLQLLSHLSMQRLLGLTAVLCIGGLGYGGYHFYQTQQNQKIIIAGKLGSEPEILMNMYKDLIEADNAHLKIELKPNFGNTTFLYRAIKNQQIDIYPEFTGTVLQNIHPQKLVSHQPEQVYHQAQHVLKQKDRLDYLQPMAYENSYALAVDQSTAQRYQLKTVSDLARVSPQLSAAFESDFYNQADGYPGIQKAYQIQFKNVKSVQPSLRYEALKNHQVQVVDAYTTDPQVKAQKLVVLKDDKHFFPPYQGAPLVRPEVLRAHPEIRHRLNKLHGKISEADMIEMNYQVAIQHKSAKTVAKEYLKTNGILK
ncbi:ABC transporter permease/substrate-binding protein [Weissella viridescens]|uniref:ABC transporter permease/substrate-binding protein n=1 Tax=Weissella viridescens TaxID=1629 RepID=A0A3P2RAQ9_WEIVI|nr:ABC transporter permease/substrate-binding protein [Weissella viridescens]RRG17593.1 ABC transporter permease/substrate-binding protein [Weissella viridescens]